MDDRAARSHDRQALQGEGVASRRSATGAKRPHHGRDHHRRERLKDGGGAGPVKRLGALLVVLATLAGCGSADPHERPGGVAIRFDPTTLHPSRRVAVGGNPCGIAADATTAYVVDLGSALSGAPGPGAVFTIDPRAGRVVHRTPLGRTTPCNLVLASGGLVVEQDQAFTRIDDGVRWTVRAGRDVEEIALAHGVVWAADMGAGRVLGIDAATGRRIAAIPARFPIDVAGGAGAVWVADRSARAVLRIDPATLAVRRLRLRSEPLLVAAGHEGLFVIRGQHTLSRLDPSTGRVLATFPRVTVADDLAVGHGAVWLLLDTGSLLKLDPTTLRVLRRARIGGDPFGLAITPDAVWVGTRRNPARQ
jgi:DNA-binding beta-propeller fold protein YncE